MRDVLLVTVECARWDHRHHLDLPDFDATHGVAPGHYTRPSLAGLHSGQWRSVAETQVHGPTLAETLSDAGYATAAVSYSPQTVAPFGFAEGFGCHHLLRGGDGRLSRGSHLRERLAESRLVRRLKRRVADKHATFEGIPPDARSVDQARAIMERHRGEPLFLWVHLMGSHRPYGWGAGALPRDASTAAAAATSDSPVSDDVADMVRSRYRAALERITDHLSALSDAAGDAVVVVAGDHGEELGEEGYWFHGGYRRRLVDTIVDVPVFTRGMALPDGPVTLLDLPAHLCARLRLDTPDAWDARTRRDYSLSLAPWNGRASVRYQADGVDLTLRDGELGDVTGGVDAPEVGEQLRALGYAGVG